MNKIFAPALFACLFTVLISCRKDSFINSSDASASTSEDSLYFDTLFTTQGSVTQYFKLYNDNNRKLLISHISLTGGETSYFKINADGFSGPTISNLEMQAHDSLYVFVTVNINPSAANLPFIAEDSIGIEFNGNQKWVQLRAWGQNAHFLSSDTIRNNTTWTNEKPYVITGGLVIDENATLTIQEGTRVYLHADAPIFVDGTIVASGNKSDSSKIIFRGDRLDDPYRNYPAAWPGIYFREKSKDNVLTYTIIKNAYQGIVSQTPADNGNTKLTLNACIIDDCYDAGLMGIGSTIDATNCLFSNCGKNIVLADGGDYQFRHCTDAAYSNTLIAHKQPVLAISNFLRIGDNVVTSDLRAAFTNCIFWGDNGIVEDEVGTAVANSAAFNATFSNCLWKVTTAPENTTSLNMIENLDPSFFNIDTRKEIYDFHLLPNSPAIDAGAVTGLATDLDGNVRDPNFPDIGAYESAF